MKELNKVVDKVLESLKEKKNIKITKHNDLGMETVLFELLPDNYEQLVKNGRQQGKTEHAIIEELRKIGKEAYDEGYNDGYKSGSKGVIGEVAQKQLSNELKMKEFDEIIDRTMVKING